jgi:hypothetical protein
VILGKATETAVLLIEESSNTTSIAIKAKMACIFYDYSLPGKFM